MNRYIFITILAFLPVSNLFSQADKQEERPRMLPMIIAEDIDERESDPYIIDEDKEIIRINDETFILTSPRMEKAFGLLHVIPPSLKKEWPDFDFGLYSIKDNVVTENFFVLHVGLYEHNKGAKITNKDNHIEIVADFFEYTERAYMYIINKNGQCYWMLQYDESPCYYLLNGRCRDKDGVPYWANQQLAKQVWYQYLKDNSQFSIKLKSQMLSAKGVRQIKEYLGMK